MRLKETTKEQIVGLINGVGLIALIQRPRIENVTLTSRVKLRGSESSGNTCSGRVMAKFSIYIDEKRKINNETEHSLWGWWERGEEGEEREKQLGKREKTEEREQLRNTGQEFLFLKSLRGRWSKRGSIEIILKKAAIRLKRNINLFENLLPFFWVSICPTYHLSNLYLHRIVFILQQQLQQR